MSGAQATWFGDYRLDRLVGRGGMGQVWRAYHAPMDRFVALKLLPADLADDDEYRRRFEREARTAARLQSPHLVAIHSFGQIEDQLYIDMALIEGVDVTALLRERGPMPPARAVELIAQVASAVDAAHAVGLIHRDIKPSNILVNPNGFAYLIDFGIAKPRDETGLTTTGATIGTIAYMAPERFNGEVTPGADIYALGCVLAECLIGRRAFAGDSAAEQIHGHLNLAPPQPSTMRPDIPPALDQVIARALAKHPSDRYPSAGELVADARRALAGEPIYAGSYSTAPPRPNISDATAPRTWATEKDRTYSATNYSGGMQAPGHPGPGHSGTAPQQPGPPNRGRRIGLIAAGVVALCAVAAAAIFFAVNRNGESGSTSAPEEPTASVTDTATETTETPTDTSAPESSKEALPDSFIGNWTGTATDGLITFDIVVTLSSGNIGDELGTSSNTSKLSGSHCERAESLLTVQDPKITLRARLSGGEPNCVDDGSISTLIANPDGTLQYSWPNPFGMPIKGTLHRN